MCIVNMARHVGFMYGSRMDTDPVACYYGLFFLSVIFSAKFTNSPSVMCNVWYFVGVGVSVCILLM